MSNSLQDLEQEVLQCWGVTEDLKLFAEEYKHCDVDVYNKALGLAYVYEMRFNKAWETYEKLVEEHYKMRKENNNGNEE